MLAQAKSTFRNLVRVDADHHKVIELIEGLRRDVDLSIDDTGWALWNLCDRYAMLRDAEQQHAIHAEFFTWGQEHLAPDRLHWVVSDTTQAWTLIHGGYADRWWRWYRYANDHVPRLPANRNARFESHRVAAASGARFRAFSQAANALQRIEDVIAEDPNWGNLPFMKTTLLELQVAYLSASRQATQVSAVSQSLVASVLTWIEAADDVAAVPQAERPLLGSWEQLNAMRTPRAVFIAMHNAACVLAEAGLFAEAEALFDLLLERNETITAYGEALYLLSCWQRRGHVGEIIDYLSTSKIVTPAALAKFAPAVYAAVKDHLDD